MKKISILALVAVISFACKDKQKEVTSEAKEVIAEVKQDVLAQNEWTDLTIDHWQAFKGGELPPYWKVEDGAIVFHPPSPEDRMQPDGKKQSFNIVTKKEYTSFELTFDWKISDTGNSGVIWGVSEGDAYSQPYQTGLEVQILDNDKHPDGKNGTSHQAGALYDLVSPSKDATKPVGEWNTATITINHASNQGSSVLNGVEVATFPVNGAPLEALLKGSKFDGWDGFGMYKTGKIALQDHNDMVSFRNIKIKEL